MGAVRYKMKYEIGNKIKLKEDINTTQWDKALEKEYLNLNPKVATILSISNNFISLKEISGIWFDREIEGLYSESKPITNPVKSRFELLDIRENNG